MIFIYVLFIQSNFERFAKTIFGFERLSAQIRDTEKKLFLILSSYRTQ